MANQPFNLMAVPPKSNSSTNFHDNDVRFDSLFYDVQFSPHTRGKRAQLFHGTNKTIPASCQSLDVSVLSGRISEHFAQLTNRRIQTIIEINKSFRGP